MYVRMFMYYHRITMMHHNEYYKLQITLLASCNATYKLFHTHIVLLYKQFMQRKSAHCEYGRQ